MYKFHCKSESKWFYTCKLRRLRLCFGSFAPKTVCPPKYVVSRFEMPVHFCVIEFQFKRHWQINEMIETNLPKQGRNRLVYMCKITLIRIYNETCTYKTCNNILVIIFNKGWHYPLSMERRFYHAILINTHIVNSSWLCMKYLRLDVKQITINQSIPAK
jgi:hypothetical protein